MEPTVPLRIVPAPVPTTWELGLDPNNNVVILTAHTTAGINFFFMDADGAERFAEQLTLAAKQAKTGLILAGPGVIQ